MNSNIPEERYGFSKQLNAEQLEELPDNSSDIFENGLMSIHMKGPTTGKIEYV